VAVSGGRTPWLMLRALARDEVPWESVHVVQVDERVAAAGHEMPDVGLYVELGPWGCHFFRLYRV